ncbi:MAG TPA: alpha/beta fold hydrolase [Dehalococcoidia bacterium]|nr:alpha/beta fold hydrolase [Dehalococcoidia bacterium]
MKKTAGFLKVDKLNLVGEVCFPEITNQPLPAVCLCHGIPAIPYNPTDHGYPVLAERFCAAGFITLIFNFRGTGQSQGNLDIFGWTQDLKAAIDFLSNLGEVNKSSFCLLGFSGGAAVSVYGAANDPRISSVIACACPADFNFLVDKQQAKSLVAYFRSIGVIRDRDFPPSIDEWLEGFSMVSPIRWIDKISPRPLLLIHGEKDELVAVEHAFRLYEQAAEPKEIVIIPGAGHRLRLEEEAIATALNWLKTHC